MSSKFVAVCFALISLIFFVFCIHKLNWGNNYFFQPDENNMATAITKLSPASLDPHFYAYGQFPLYSSYLILLFVSKIFPILGGPPFSFESAIYVLRLQTAVYTVLSSLFIFLFLKKLSRHKLTPLLGSIIFYFLPGIIQLSSFGTTEMLLVSVFTAQLYFAYSFSTNPKLSKILFASLILGLGIGSKISSAIFSLPIMLSLAFSLKHKKTNLTTGFYFFVLFTFVTTIITLLSSPYNLKNTQDFLSSMRYETQVATGEIKVFYTSQFDNTTPYLFQIYKVFPYAWGIPIFLLLPFSLLFSLYKPKHKFYLLLVLFSSFFYFLYFGALYTKWFRFMSPLFILPSYFLPILFEKIKSVFAKTIILLLCLFPGFIFSLHYFSPDIRIQTSSWIAQNIPINSTILSEAGNVVNLPLTSKPYNVINFDFFNLDQNPELKQQLVDSIYKSDYILIPSRRIFANQHGPRFPISEKYYKAIFSNHLGFVKIQQFSPSPAWQNYENAEETFTVFDMPTIRLYKKVKQLDPDTIQSLL